MTYNNHINIFRHSLSSDFLLNDNIVSVILGRVVRIQPYPYLVVKRLFLIDPNTVILSECKRVFKSQIHPSTFQLPRLKKPSIKRG